MSNPFFESTPHTISPSPHNDEDQELHTQRKNVKIESLESSRRTRKELEKITGVAAKTLVQVNEQSEKISRADNALSAINDTADSAAYQVSEMSRLKRFIPFIWKKKEKKRAEAEKEAQRFRSEQQRRDMTESNAYMGKIKTNNALKGSGYEQDLHEILEKEGDKKKLSKEERKERELRKQEYEAAKARCAALPSRKQNTSDVRDLVDRDDAEKAVDSEIDANLDAMSGFLSSLKNMSIEMGENFAEQNQTLAGMREKADTANQKIYDLDKKVKKMV